MPTKIIKTPRCEFDCPSIEAAAAKGQLSIKVYSGGPLRFPQFDAPLFLDLNGHVIGFERPVPLLRDHDTHRIVGQVQARRVGNAIEALGKLIGDSADRKQVAELAADGYTWQAQGGARPIRVSKIKAGQAFNINGRRATGPAYIATAWRLTEVSIVTLGDEETQVSIAASDGTRTAKRCPSQLKRPSKRVRLEVSADVRAAIVRARQNLPKSEEHYRTVKRLFRSISQESSHPVVAEWRERVQKRNEENEAESLKKLREARERREAREAEKVAKERRRMLEKAAKEGRIKRELAQLRAEIRMAELQELQQLREEYEATRPARLARQARELSDKLRAARRAR